MATDANDTAQADAPAQAQPDRADAAPAPAAPARADDSDSGRGNRTPPIDPAAAPRSGLAEGSAEGRPAQNTAEPQGQPKDGAGNAAGKQDRPAEQAEKQIKAPAKAETSSSGAPANSGDPAGDETRKGKGAPQRKVRKPRQVATREPSVSRRKPSTATAAETAPAAAADRPTPAAVDGRMEPPETPAAARKPETKSAADKVGIDRTEKPVPEMPKRRQTRVNTPSTVGESRARTPAKRAGQAAIAGPKSAGSDEAAAMPRSAGQAPRGKGAGKSAKAKAPATIVTDVVVDVTNVVETVKTTRASKSPVADADKKRWSPFAAYARGAERLLVRMRPEKLVTAQDIIEEIGKGPQGPLVIAAFDFDGTLVGGLTGAMLMQERMRRKEVTRAEIVETAGVTFRAMTKLIEANEVVAHSMAQWAGKTDEEMQELGAHLFEHKIQDAVFPEMRQIIDAHRAAGHTVIVATSASSYQVEPTVKSLGIDHLLCTQVEVAEGKLTGKLVGDSLFGAGKVAAIKKFIAEHGSTLADTYFYGDGDEEVGLMEAVGYPQPTNPGRRLVEAARAAGWPILRLQSRGSAQPRHFLRGIAGLMTIMPILQAGLAVGLMTRDKRQAANLIMPTWIQTQLDLAGVKLRLSGRKNLWARRPAVFIFNHRNNFDGSFVAALVRTDYVSIAKKDMAKNPVGKLVAAIMPTVFVDRGQGTAESAALTLQPVVEAVDKGYSIMLAPEGTRVRGIPGEVGPFKKGAFHMAMAAGIPVVPVVIRNALDVASRDGGAMRPGTVDIAVLPPISVKEWTAADLSRHVEDVRQLFIETLQNWPEPDEEEVEEG